MNILILSAGRRTKLVEYFKSEFSAIGGKVITTDCSELAPAIYLSDKYYVVPKIDDKNYIDRVIDICIKEKINAVISLIDPELNLLSKFEDKFNEINTKLYISKFDSNEICFDKYKMFEFLNENKFNCAKTYLDIENFKKDLKNGKISMPVFVKPRFGSASLGINKVSDIKHIEILFELSKDLIVQEFLNGDEYGADCYIDYISNKVVSIFVKKKLSMRAGETDKSISYKNDDLFKIIEQFVNKLNCRGAIDIDIFNVNGKWYISEVNPRFGGGYPHAYECGCNFPKFIMNNLNGLSNREQIGEYQEGIIMLKHDTITILNRA